MAQPSTLDQVTNLAKRRGFVFQAGEIYGGSRSAWDYGPLGVELKENIKSQWWNTFVRGRGDMVGLDSSIILPRQVWEASGHVETFVDRSSNCSASHAPARHAHLVAAFEEKHGRTPELSELACPNCGTRGKMTEPRTSSGLVRTFLGPVADEEGLHYLRPETAQGMYLNFLNVMNTSRKKPPFGIAQMGKAFRNEITPGNFIFRTREFEQIEIQFFIPPTDADQWFETYVDEAQQWLCHLGINPDNLRQYNVPDGERAHYSSVSIDLEYTFGFAGGDWGELMGIANRGDYDLSNHTAGSGTKMQYFDRATGERYTPYVIEPSWGLTRSLMAFLVDAYSEDEAPNTKGGTEKRTVLRLDPRLAPVKAAVLPLSKKRELAEPENNLAAALRKRWNVDYDDAGAIGRRYRRHDEIGTPYCVTFDFDSLDDNAVTVRDRDTMAQERVSL